MATVLTRNGRRSIQFYDAGGKRKTLALGKVSKKQADFVKTKIEALLAASYTGHPPDDEVSAWLAKREPPFLEKLAEVGLIPRKASVTLGRFLDEYTHGRIDVEIATQEVWSQPVRNLKECFGEEKLLMAITPGDAEGFRLYLTSQGLAPTTIHKRLQFARQFFRAAQRHKLVAENPFQDVRSTAGTDPSRKRFIVQADANRLLEACPNMDWRLIVTLSRFGGMRCPSEVLSLRWQDIDWEAGRVLVTSPKTKRHPGKATRIIPLFPELRCVLEEARCDPARAGHEYVVNEKFRRAALGPRGWRGCNLRTPMEKIIRRAGLQPWPRLFHNLRASRETELTERFPLHVVAAWLGNTPEIARKHYLQVTDEHFQAAVGRKAALQPALLQPAESSRREEQVADEVGALAGIDQALNTKPCQDLRCPATACAAVVSACEIRKNGEDRSRPSTSRKCLAAYGLRPQL
jgi:integrase